MVLHPFLEEKLNFLSSIFYLLEMGSFYLVLKYVFYENKDEFSSIEKNKKNIGIAAKIEMQ